jgi:hypothetical protein
VYAGEASVASAFAGQSSILVDTAEAPSPARVGLGSAASFAGLGAPTVTTTGPTTMTGDLGLGPGGAITGSQALTSKPLTPGVSKSTSSLDLTGDVTLDSHGDPSTGATTTGAITGGAARSGTRGSGSLTSGTSISTSNTPRLPATGAPPSTAAGILAGVGMILAGALLQVSPGRVHASRREGRRPQRSTTPVTS